MTIDQIKPGCRIKTASDLIGTIKLVSAISSQCEVKWDELERSASFDFHQIIDGLNCDLYSIDDLS